MTFPPFVLSAATLRCSLFIGTPLQRVLRTAGFGCRDRFCASRVTRFSTEKEAMVARTKPALDEFDISGNVVIHKPTGATWVAYKGAKTPHSFTRGALGRTLPTGDDYYPEEVAAFAHKLIADRIKPVGA
jgi:hypothetical protein